MARFIQYIVFLVLTFNIFKANASDVTFKLEENNNPKYISSEFKSVFNLPHPIVFKQMIDSSEKTTSEKLLMIGYYFDAKYPNNIIEYDFSEDVAIIFPELTSQEVIKRTSLIRSAVKTYRWGKEKYKQIATDMIAPKAPPLLVDEDEYALLGTVDYIPVPEGSFAVINDFKKVVSYSNDKKDIEAMEVYRLRQLEKKANKTDYEKFKSMVSKLKLSKIASYGVDLPNPFIGNVGIGKWVEHGAYKARTISEIAQIHHQDSFLAGVHISVPNHRFMLANSLSETLHKPKIELFDTKNIESYEVLYPLSVPFADEQMVHAYSSDFIFPIKIKTIHPNEEVAFSSKISFSDCDMSLNCELMQISSNLDIEKGIDNISSAIKNFLRQSFFSIPTEENKYLKIDEIYADTLDDKQTVENIKMVVSFEKKPKDFSVLIENEQNTRFSAPQIAINDDKIYITITPLSDNNDLLKYPLTVSIKLNGYSYIRKTVNLEPYSPTDKINDDIIYTIWISFLSGLLFYTTPIGVMLLCLGLSFINTKSTKKNAISWFISSFGILLISFFICTYITKCNQDIYWGRQYTDIFYLSLSVLATMGIMLSVKYKQQLLSSFHKLRAVIYSILVVCLFFYANPPYIEQLFVYINDSTKTIYIFIFIILGLVIVPIGLGLRQLKCSKLPLSQKARSWLSVIIYYTALISFIYLSGVLFLQVSLSSFAKIMIIYGICYLLYKYFYNFIESLYNTDLSKKEKHIAENIILFLALIMMLSGAKISSNYADLVLSNGQKQISLSDIEEKLKQNKIVIVGINANWSYMSAINQLTTFDNYTFKRLEKVYNVEYIDINTNIITPQIRQFMQEYNTYSLPIYILYTINLNKGFVLPQIVKSTELEQIIQNLKI